MLWRALYWPRVAFLQTGLPAQPPSWQGHQMRLFARDREFPGVAHESENRNASTMGCAAVVKTRVKSIYFCLRMAI